MGFGGIIQQLIDEGVLVLYHDYRSGSFKDWSGNDNDGTPTNTTWNDGSNAQRFSESDSRITVSDSPELQMTEGTYVVLGDFDSQIPFGRLIIKRDGGGAQLSWSIASTTKLRVFDGTDVRDITIDIKGKKYLAVNYKNGEIPEAFSDGISAGNYPGIVAVTTNDAEIRIGNYYTNNTPLENPLFVAMIINRKLTDTEHAQLYAQLSNMKWPKKVTGKSMGDTKVDASESGLVLGYNMKPVNNTLIDQSSVGADGIINGATYEKHPVMGDVMRFDGVASNISLDDMFASNPSEFTISLWFKSNDTATEARLISLNNDGFLGNIVINSSGASEIKGQVYDGSTKSIATSSYNVLAWNHAVITAKENDFLNLYINGKLIGTPQAVGNFSEVATQGRRLGSNRTATANFFDGLITKPKVFDAQKDIAWALAEYNKVKNTAVQFKTDWNALESIAIEGGTKGDYLSNTPFQFGDTAFRGQVVASIINGKTVKAIMCTTAGLIYVKTDIFSNNNTEPAYGEWEWWLNKDNSSNFRIMFIADIIGDRDTAGQNGYYWFSAVPEGIAIGESANGTPFNHLTTSSGTVPVGVWSKQRITRTANGVFTTYIDDIAITAVTGSNPFTDTTSMVSNYIVILMGVDDKIALGDLSGNYGLTKRLLA